MIGESVLHYRIIGRIGAGGMGQVFKAEDTRLGRFVALKLLSRNLENDPAARERFEREARAVSALNHPGICTLFDIGEDTSGPNPRRFLVMELLEGRTLREVIAGRPLEANQFLDIALLCLGPTRSGDLGFEVNHGGGTGMRLSPSVAERRRASPSRQRAHWRTHATGSITRAPRSRGSS